MDLDGLRIVGCSKHPYHDMLAEKRLYKMSNMRCSTQRIVKILIDGV